MKFHRVNDQVVRLPGQDDAELTPTSKLLLDVLTANPPDASDPLKKALPFQPRSYRDFMLFEKHYYGASVGMTSLYAPSVNLLGRAYSLLTFGGEFPWFRPAPLWHTQPIYYQSNHLAFYADGATVVYPRYATYLDVELELGVVLGRPLYNATVEEAAEAIAGYCVFNDFSARNVQMAEMNSGFGPQHSKAFASSISSVVVSADELAHLARGRPPTCCPPLAGRVLINGRVASETAAAGWKFSLAEALAGASRSTRLHPGEFFASGTFPGGAGIEHARFQLRVGDVVTLEIDGVGSVTNTIVAEEE
ncbi:hypothetical protein BX600DRAFT_533990 [Xylariales sp. PMI_506]|nr:hypothetical protein BX600DRAFT_533990 [Xylariales sp. PMI_506]